MKLYCELDGKEIDKEKVHKGGAKRRPRFCNANCSNEWRRQHGFFKEFSAVGNAAQRLYKEEHGVVPGYEQRKAALQRPDRTNKRGKHHK